MRQSDRPAMMGINKLRTAVSVDKHLCAVAGSRLASDGPHVQDADEAASMNELVPEPDLHSSKSCQNNFFHPE